MAREASTGQKLCDRSWPFLEISLCMTFTFNCNFAVPILDPITVWHSGAFPHIYLLTLSTMTKATKTRCNRPNNSAAGGAKHCKNMKSRTFDQSRAVASSSDDEALSEEGLTEEQRAEQKASRDRERKARNQRGYYEK